MLNEMIFLNSKNKIFWQVKSESIENDEDTNVGPNRGPYLGKKIYFIKVK